MAKPVETPVFTLPRSTDSDSRRATTRREIVGAVRDLLAGGASYYDLSVNRIAQAAGVSRATFYLHFNDKRQLLAALADQELSEWRALADPLFENPAAGYDELVVTIRELLALWDSHRGVLSALIELAEYDDDARMAWRGAVESVATTIAAYTEQRNDIDVADAQMSGRLMAWMAERACHQILDGASATEREALVETLANVIWRSRKPND